MELLGEDNYLHFKNIASFLRMIQCRVTKVEFLVEREGA